MKRDVQLFLRSKSRKKYLNFRIHMYANQSFFYLVVQIYVS